MRKQDDMKPSQIKSTDMTQRPVGREYGRIPNYHLTFNTHKLVHMRCSDRYKNEFERLKIFQTLLFPDLKIMDT